MIKLKCECCGFEEEFKDNEEAFQAGWDEPTHLPNWPVSCNLCPGVCAMGIEDHSAAHKKWKEEGRPEEFTTEGIGTPERATELQEAANRIQELLKEKKPESPQELFQILMQVRDEHQSLKKLTDQERTM